MLNRTRWLATASLGGLGALSVGPAWAVPAAAPNHSAASVAVLIDQDAYAPDPVTAFVGDTVTWTNADDIPHDVYGSGGPSALRSPMLSAGESWSYVAVEPGSYAYVCTIHEGMVGALTITADDDAVEPPVVDAVTPETTVLAEPQDDVAAAPVAAPAAPVEATAAPVAAVAPVTTPVVATVPEPAFRLDLWLVGVALLAFALIAMALLVLSPERDG